MYQFYPLPSRLNDVTVETAVTMTTFCTLATFRVCLFLLNWPTETASLRVTHGLAYLGFPVAAFDSETTFGS